MSLFPALLIAAEPGRLLHLSFVDVVVIALYFVMVIGIGFYLKGFTKTGEDFFLAGRDIILTRIDRHRVVLIKLIRVR